MDIRSQKPRWIKLPRILAPDHESSLDSIPLRDTERTSFPRMRGRHMSSGLCHKFVGFRGGCTTSCGTNIVAF